MPAGLPTTLRDGDIILFGSDSQLRVRLTPASDEGTTVEQHLRAECKQRAQRIQVHCPPCQYSAGFLLVVDRGCWCLPVLSMRCCVRVAAGAGGAACE